jgi:hypothetical protein
VTTPSLAMQREVLRAAGWPEPGITRLERLRARTRRELARPWTYALFYRWLLVTGRLRRERGGSIDG